MKVSQKELNEALHEAIRNSSVDMVKSLLKAGADPNYSWAIFTSKRRKGSMLSVARRRYMDYGGGDTEEILDLLHKYGAKDDEG